MATSLVLHGMGAAFALVVLPQVRARPAGRAEEVPTVLELSVDGTLPEAQGQPPPVARTPTHHVRRSSGKPAAPIASSLTAPTSPRATPPTPLSEVVPAAPVEAERPAAALRMARFALSAGSIAGRSDAAGAADGVFHVSSGARVDSAADSGQGRAGTSAGDDTSPETEGAVDAPAHLASSAPLLYPEAARRAELELDLPLELVVSRQGRVLSATALVHPGYGLEQAALAAVRSYVFIPARRGGRAVAVKMRWMMQFRLR
jgi:protein TonB